MTMSWMRRGFRAGAVLLLAVLGGCTDAAIGMVNALVPNGTYRVARNISYGTDPRQRLDVYRPAQPGRYPVVVFFYGGSWRYGARGQYTFLGEALSSHGIVAVIADYRLYPAVRFPAFQDDAAHALGWTYAHIAAHDGDPQDIVVMGHSAGANIAALLALDPAYAHEAPVPSGAIRAFVGLAGPYTFHPENTASVRDVFAGLANPDAARPITFVGQHGTPLPMFVAHGRADDTVWVTNTQQMAALARAAGGTVVERHYDNVGHLGIMAAFARPFRHRAPVLDDVAAFVNGLPRKPAS